jgi:hypothetical protein
MRVRTAQHGRVQHARQFDVFDVGTAPSQDAWMLATVDALANPGTLFDLPRWISSHQAGTAGVPTVAPILAAAARIERTML